MSGYPAILIPKLECGYFDFEPTDTPIKKKTVAALKTLCKENGLTQVGRKADLVNKLQEAGHLQRNSKHPIGPRWFWFDEAFGQGEHTLHYLCICGAAMSMERDFQVSNRTGSTNVVAPSIMCGNKSCGFHIWGKLDGFKPPKKRSYYSGAYVYLYMKHRPYNHENDCWSSRLFK